MSSAGLERGASHPLSASSARLSDEKARTSEIEKVDGDEKGAEPEVFNADVDVSGVDERKLMRKLDWHLIPWLSFLYLLSFLDRTSIGNARVRRVHCELRNRADLDTLDSYMAWKRTCTSAISNT